MTTTEEVTKEFALLSLNDQAKVMTALRIAKDLKDFSPEARGTIVSMVDVLINRPA